MQRVHQGKICVECHGGNICDHLIRRTHCKICGGGLYDHGKFSQSARNVDHHLSVNMKNCDEHVKNVMEEIYVPMRNRENNVKYVIHVDILGQLTTLFQSNGIIQHWKKSFPDYILSIHNLHGHQKICLKQ